MTSPALSGTGIVTGEAVVLDVRPARLGSRSIAAVLDFFISSIAVYFVFVILGVAVITGGRDVDQRLLAAISIGAGVLFFVGYPVISQTIFGGRTIGKAALGIRAVRIDGGTLRLRHAAVRSVASLVEFPLGIAAVASLLSPTGRRVGDMFAGTAVIHDRIPVLGRMPLVMPPPLILEALCQAGTWLVMITTDRRKRAALLSIGSVDFLAPVRPGDVLMLEGECDSMSDEVAVVSGRAIVDGTPVLEAKDIMCALIDAQDLADLDDTERLQKLLTRAEA